VSQLAAVMKWLSQSISGGPWIRCELIVRKTSHLWGRWVVTDEKEVLKQFFCHV